MDDFAFLPSGSPEFIVETLVSAGDLRGARTALEYFRNHNLHFNGISEQLGAVYYALGEHEKAASLFRTNGHDTSAENLLNLACCNFASGDLVKCKEILSKVKGYSMSEETASLRNRIIASLKQSVDPADFPETCIFDQICLVRNLCDANEYKKAISVLSRLLPHTDEEEMHTSILHFIGRCYYELGNYKEALLYSERSRGLLHSQLLAGCCLYEMGECERADHAMYTLRHLDNFFVENNRCVFNDGCRGDQVWSGEDSGDSRYNYCVFLLKERRFRELFNLLSTTGCPEDSFFKANALIGLANESDLELVRAEYMREAKSLLVKICDGPFANISEGLVCFMEGDFEEALRCWEHESVVGEWNMGLCLAQAGRWSEAIVRLCETPDCETRSKILVPCYVRCGQIEKAETECLLWPRLWSVMGVELVACDKYSQAFDCFMRGTEYVESNEEKQACFGGLNDSARRLWKLVIDTGKMHAELDRLVAKLASLTDNKEGLEILKEIESWINEHLSYVCVL